MGNKILKRGVVVLFITLILFSTFGTTFAAINESYNAGKDVVDDDLDTKVKDSVILDALATFVYSIGSMVENLVGKAFKGLTGSNYFPWADRVLFNSIAMLDVNIFNPATSSLFKNNEGKITPLASIVRNTYFTILTIAIGFLTIVVAIAGIRLAITSIASEKAKYKETITNWLFAIVLIFLMHNLISFVLWTNEKMVEVASSLLSNQLDDASQTLYSALAIDNAKALENFLKANKSNISWLNSDMEDFFNNEDNANVAYFLLSNSNYQDSILFDAFGDASHTIRNSIKEFFTGNGKQSSVSLQADIEFIKTGSTSYDIFDQASSANSGIVTGSGTITTSEFLNENIANKTDEQIKETKGYQLFYYRIQKFIGGDAKHINVSYYKKYREVMKNAISRFRNQVSGSQNTSSDTPDLLADLGEYFKEAAYVVPTDDDTGELTGWHRSKLTIQGALLYAIFVFQSIFYFFAYLKRFFYIVILIIMAPAIVIVDFLQKSLMS